MLNSHAGKTTAVSNAYDTERDSLIDEIGASMGARYHNPALYENGNAQEQQKD